MGAESTEVWKLLRNIFGYDAVDYDDVRDEYRIKLACKVDAPLPYSADDIKQMTSPVESDNQRIDPELAQSLLEILEPKTPEAKLRLDNLAVVRKAAVAILDKIGIPLASGDTRPATVYGSSDEPIKPDDGIVIKLSGFDQNGVRMESDEIRNSLQKFSANDLDDASQFILSNSVGLINENPSNYRIRAYLRNIKPGLEWRYNEDSDMFVTANKVANPSDFIQTLKFGLPEDAGADLTVPAVGEGLVSIPADILRTQNALAYIEQLPDKNLKIREFLEPVQLGRRANCG